MNRAATCNSVRVAFPKLKKIAVFWSCVAVGGALLALAGCGGSGDRSTGAPPAEVSTSAGAKDGTLAEANGSQEPGDAKPSSESQKTNKSSRHEEAGEKRQGISGDDGPKSPAAKPEVKGESDAASAVAKAGGEGGSPPTGKLSGAAKQAAQAGGGNAESTRSTELTGAAAEVAEAAE